MESLRDLNKTNGSAISMDGNREYYFILTLDYSVYQTSSLD